MNLFKTGSWVSQASLTERWYFCIRLKFRYCITLRTFTRRWALE